MLEIANLHHRYPGADREALRGVNLNARAGEVTGLLGPNGAGKSTLMGLVAGLLPLQQGHILLNGQAAPLAGWGRTIAFAPQTDAFYPMLTAHENLACFAAACGLHGAQAHERIRTVLTQVQLERHRQQRAGRLSGGLKRRLNLAIALLGQPQLLILDEPTASVDPQSRTFLLRVISDLAQAGVAVLFSSHLMSEVEALATEVVILDQGRVLRAGSLSSLLAQANATLTLDLTKDSPTVETVLTPLGRLVRQTDRWQLHLHAGCSAPQALTALEVAGIPIQGASFGRSSLEDIFMALTHEALRDD